MLAAAGGGGDELNFRSGFKELLVHFRNGTHADDVGVFYGGKIERPALESPGDANRTEGSLRFPDVLIERNKHDL